MKIREKNTRYICSARWGECSNGIHGNVLWNEINRGRTHERRKMFLRCVYKSYENVFVWFVLCELFCRSHLPVIFHCVFGVRCIFDGNFLLLTHTCKRRHNKCGTNGIVEFARIRFGSCWHYGTMDDIRTCNKAHCISKADNFHGYNVNQIYL